MATLIEQITNGALKFIEKRMDKSTNAITGAIENISGTLGKNVDTQSRVLAQALQKIEKATDRMNEPTFDVEVDMSPLVSELKSVSKTLGVISKNKSPEIKNVEATLKLILTAIKESSASDVKTELQELRKVMKGIKTYETIKLDDAQIKALMASGQQGSIVTGGGVLSARNVTVDNTTITDADTEYSYTFPKNTVSWELRVRNTDIPLLVSYTTGKLPTSGDGTAYFTVPAYYIQQNTGLDWGGKTIYVQSETASQVLEVIAYRA